ncbi:MAG: ABC transporter ATP-binding protein, partial [Oscillospiraceae bacterium]
MLKRFFSYYKPHKKLFISDMMASFMISLLGITYPIITRNMLNVAIPQKNLQLIFTYGISLSAIYFVRMLLRFFVQYYGHIMGVKIQANMRLDMFNKLQTLPFSFYDENETGRIMSRMTNDLMDISELAHHGPEHILISGFMIFGSFFYLYSIEPTLTAIIYACIPILLFFSLYFKDRMREAFTETKKDIAVINASLESSISGIRVTKAFTNSKKEEEKFNVGNKKFVSSRSTAYKAMAQFSSTTSFITDIFNVVVLSAGGYFLCVGKITAADYSAFIISVNLFINPLTMLIEFVEQYQNGVTGFKRFLEIMDEPSEKENPDVIDVKGFEGEISFDDVSFSYNDSNDILENVSFDIKKGERAAFVGPSGGGKTTICHLIPHFYNIATGSIKIDGIDIKNISLDSLRKNIGIVQQDIYLFNGSIKENILYGRLNATDEEVIEAAKRANIHEYIMSLPNQYETNIGERGIK